jgi:hypothetical protein
MNNELALPAACNTSSQLRYWLRFPPDESKMSVIIRNEQKCATILDDSFGGIGATLELDDSVNVQVGDQLTVLYYGSPTTGQVRWLEHGQEDHKVRLGICWSS